MLTLLIEFPYQIKKPFVIRIFVKAGITRATRNSQRIKVINVYLIEGHFRLYNQIPVAFYCWSQSRSNHINRFQPRFPAPTEYIGKRTGFVCFKPLSQKEEYLF